LIIVNNFQIGGKDNGKLLQNIHQKEQYLIIISIILEILKVVFNHVNLLNGLKHFNP
jgi:hypothetical protein